MNRTVYIPYYYISDKGIQEDIGKAWDSDGVVAIRATALESQQEVNPAETADLQEWGHLLQANMAADSAEGRCPAAEGGDLAVALDPALLAGADLMDHNENMAGVVRRRTLRSRRGRVGDSVEADDFQCCFGVPWGVGWWLRRTLWRSSVMVTLLCLERQAV